MACGRPNGIHRPALSSGQAHVLPRRLKIRSQSANGSAAKEESMSTTSSAPETEAPPAEPVADHEAADEFWGADTGATTAEYAITTLAAMNELGHTQPAVPLARPCRGQRRRTPGDSVALTYEATRSQGGVPAPLSRPVRTRGEAWIGTRRSGSESASESTWTCPAHDSPMTRRCSWLTWWTTTRTTGGRARRGPAATTA